MSNKSILVRHFLSFCSILLVFNFAKAEIDPGSQETSEKAAEIKIEAKAEEISTSQTSLTLGVLDGKYEGSGWLRQWGFIPIHYVSTRVIKSGIIEAHTVALMGLAEAAARLQILQTTEGKFKILDMDALDEQGKMKVAGSGNCDESACKFSATVMGGKLTLNETWVASPEKNSFTLTDSSQIFNGSRANYSGSFQRQLDSK